MRFSRAFWLLAFVIGFQLTLSGFVVVGCLNNHNTKCSDGKIARSFESIVAQCFALYAAEISLQHNNKHD
tara:strand:- start:1034 stop:1243 length:210 start_codon:yes stop_codon:yes gene_type:complete